MKGDYQKALKKFTMFFLSNPVPFKGLSYQKKDLELVTSCSSGYKTSSEKSFISYTLSDPVWWYNLKQFLSYSKPIWVMLANSWHRRKLHFHLTFCIWKVWKGREKLQTFEYLENENSFLDEIRNIFHSFWWAIIWWKNRNFIKNRGHKL